MFLEWFVDGLSKGVNFLPHFFTDVSLESLYICHRAAVPVCLYLCAAW